jgi:hypothetical protein
MTDEQLFREIVEEEKIDE